MFIFFNWKLKVIFASNWKVILTFCAKKILFSFQFQSSTKFLYHFLSGAPWWVTWCLLRYHLFLTFFWQISHWSSFPTVCMFNMCWNKKQSQSDQGVVTPNSIDRKWLSVESKLWLNLISNIENGLDTMRVRRSGLPVWWGVLPVSNWICCWTSADSIDTSSAVGSSSWGPEELPSGLEEIF